MKPYVFRTVINITDKNKKLRLNFVLKDKDKPLQFRRNVLWTHKSFSSECIPSKIICLLSQNTDSKAKINRHQGGIMFWSFGDLLRQQYNALIHTSKLCKQFSIGIGMNVSQD